MQTIALGPLALPTALLLFFAAVGAGWTAGARLARRVEEAARALSGAGIAVAALGPVELAAVMAQGGGTDEAAIETDYEIEGEDRWA